MNPGMQKVSGKRTFLRSTTIKLEVKSEERPCNCSLNCTFISLLKICLWLFTLSPCLCEISPIRIESIGIHWTSFERLVTLIEIYWILIHIGRIPIPMGKIQTRFLMGKGIVLPSSLFWHDKPLIAYESVRMRWINISKWDNSYYFLWSKNLAIWLVSYPGVNSTPPQLNHLHPG